MSKERTRILIVDDEEIVRESLSGWLRKDGYTVATAPDGPSSIKMMRAESWSAMLVDLKMPGMEGIEVLGEAKKICPNAPVVIMTAYATVETAVAAMKMGAYDYVLKPFDPEEISLLIQKIVTQQTLEREKYLLRKALKQEYRFSDFISKNPVVQSVFKLARAAASSNSTILILGESGTGKELMARATHAESLRRGGPFVPISCAALTESLLEAELFGYERGAFTGAVARTKGKFELAHGGTLFLDEIGDISPKLQLDLLRVLEDMRFFRLGGTTPISVDVRIIAATNRDLKRAVEEGSFREDLFYRLNVIRIVLPPLRERSEDIPLLIEHFLEELSARTGRRVEGVSREAMELLMAHSWPGNVRELRNVLERGVVVASGNTLQASNLGLTPSTGSKHEAANAPGSLEEMERRHISEVLRRTEGNVSEAARILEVDRTTLYSKFRKYQLNRDEIT